jgi:hypothetical protein
MVKSILVRTAELAIGSMLLVAWMEALQWACVLNQRRKEKSF